MEYEFDRYTKVRLVAGDVRKDNELEFSVHITSRFNVGGTANGGYLTAICVAALQESLAHPHPCVTTTYFLNRCFTDQDAQVFVSKLRISKRQSIAQARIVQQGEERVRVLGNFTTFDKSNPMTTVRRPFPGNPIEKCTKQVVDPVVLPVFARGDYIMEEQSRKLWNGSRDNSGVTATYLRFADGREPDLKGLSYFSDALYPAPFNIQDVGDLVNTWVPTLELTVQYFAVPAPGYVYLYNKCTEIVNGAVGVEGSIWDSQKNLVAVTRQTALVSSMNIANNKL
eukprot:Phypoly_transcript_15618.p1 GENE.Phypoly_transcript_15618~~Phypoly_transcript_15618.p1  ORF type:complete len:283 (+),score=28.97 Phypoly_transcript_15618:57-905(+)